MKKTMPMLLSLALSVVVVAGCSSSTSTSTATPAVSDTPAATKAAPKDDDKKVTLSVVHYMVEKPKVDTFKKLTESFTKANPNINFDIQVMPVDKFSDNIKMKIAANDQPDIIFGRPAGMVEMTKAGNFLDLTNEAFSQKIDDNFKPNVTYDNKIYGLPIDLMTNGVIYNKDIFKQNGIEIPKTYSELVKVAETLKAKGIPAFAASWKDGASYMSFMWPDMWGGPLVKMPDYAGSITSGQKKFADLPEYKGFLSRVHELSQYTNSDAKDIDYDRSLQYFAQGKAAMDIMGSFAIGTIRNYNPQGNFGVFMFPSYDKVEDNYMTLSTDNTWMIGSKSKNVDAAKKFFTYMASDEGAQIWADGVQTISALKNNVKPNNVDPMASDFLALYKTGKIVNNQLKPLWYGQFDDSWQKIMVKFLYTDPKTRKVDDLQKELDTSFAKIISSSK
ncbi:ABC transporter substrate-binding protein [Paenibacillus sp. V4I5]|uniref:ABC transporter substrate-binding protein n=1 Tax=Paenibacillus sp. V4I5 TaxID=3042306 RepID=UPI00278E8482|nr:extracellular solute-binding protein [Paenibacillus sp. V4I5]MDQ0917030.1 raffinose/stachyose/melibiose transport system substrate-binding protein [Paenibacillus sp. V4I5]